MIAANLVGFENLPQTLPHYCLESFRRNNKPDALSFKDGDAWHRISGGDAIAEGSKLVGMFRAHGLLTPVWDLPSGTGAGAVEEPMAALQDRLEQSLADRSDLTSEQRAARSMLANQQVTLR